jgi:Zinc carboxypeptidase
MTWAKKVAIALSAAAIASVSLIGPASATPVCTDGYKGGPALSACGGRVFPEIANSVDYVQYLPDPATGFREYQHGLEYLAKLYPRWVSVTTLSKHFKTKKAVSAGPDGIRSYEKGDTKDGYEILVVKLTDHKVPDRKKQKLMFSLSVHGDEIGGKEGGLRAIEDLAMAADGNENIDGEISDGVKGYESTTGVKPKFHSYPVKQVLKKEAVYFVDFNIDGWAAGDRFTESPGPLYTRGNYMGTDLNRQMPTIGRINPSRNPLQESEMKYGHKFMKEIAKSGPKGKLAYGADLHGESQSRAWVDIMYPAGQFNSLKHRQLMAIAERTKSSIDDTLFMGVPNELEEVTGGDAGEGIEDYVPPAQNAIPTKPARWGTVWDTLGYTDTGFIGDYLASELGVTGMDYEIAWNHADIRAHSRPWTVVIQENFVNASRSIIKTAMAYAMYQDKEFKKFKINPKGKVAYIYNPEKVTSKDGVGTKPGPNLDGIGADGKKIKQRPYTATNMNFFKEESRFVKGGFRKLFAADVAKKYSKLKKIDTIVLADFTAPKDARGRKYNKAAYFSNLEKWVKAGGNLVLTDRALHLLGQIGVVDEAAVTDIKVYQPYANFTDFDHPMLKGLRPNARQLAEATLVGYGIGSDASPMSVVTTEAWEGAGGHVIGTTGNGSGSSDDGSQTSVGELRLGKGMIRIMGGGLAMPTETQDHRYGLKDYALTYSGLFILENSIVKPKAGSDGDGEVSSPPPAPDSDRVPVLLLTVPTLALLRRRFRH